MSIKSNNLMVGDWVIAPHHRTDTPLFVRVKNIYHEIEGNGEEDTIQDWYGNIVEVKDLSPVHITEDLLKSNGFLVENTEKEEKLLASYYAFDDINRLSIMYFPNNHVLVIQTHNKETKVTAILFCGITEYVHKFQNVCNSLGLTEISDKFKIDM